MALRPEEPKILDTGVGSTIVQHIVPGSTEPRQWGFANPKIIHIQILNAAAFKAVTGVDPPPTPLQTRMEMERMQQQWLSFGWVKAMAGLVPRML